MKYDCNVTVRTIGGVVKFIEEKDNESDNTFVSTAVIRKLLGGHKTAELFGPEGLFCVVMGCVDAFFDIENIMDEPKLGVEKLRAIKLLLKER